MYTNKEKQNRFLFVPFSVIRGEKFLYLALQLFVCCGQRLRDCAGLADGRHEVDVADPAGKYMHVVMARDARTGGFAEVHAEVDAVRSIDLADSRLSRRYQVHHLVGRGLLGLVQSIEMLVRYDQQVAGRVRINIKDDKIELGPLEDKTFLIADRVFQNIAEDATVSFGSAACGYVIVSPRTPEYIHLIKIR